MKVLAISGSLRRDSLNTRLLRAAAELAPSGVEVELLDPSVLKELPLYDAGRRRRRTRPSPPPPARRDPPGRRPADRHARVQRDDPRRAEERHRLGLAAPREAALTHKPAAVIGASTGLFGAVWAQAETRKSLGIAGAKVLEQEFPLGEADMAFGDDGLLAEPELNERLAEILGALTEHDGRAGRAAA